MVPRRVMEVSDPLQKFELRHSGMVQATGLKSMTSRYTERPE
jgi:hypothetical protein